MARIREIKPQFFLDEELAEVSVAARLLFVGLWTLADRQGRLEDRPARIKAQLFPYDSLDAEALLAELASHAGRFIVRYEIGGRRLIQVRSFSRHQKPHCKEQPSVLPPPNLTAATGGHRAPTRAGDDTTGAEHLQGEGSPGADPMQTTEEHPSSSPAPWAHGHMGNGGLAGAAAVGPPPDDAPRPPKESGAAPPRRGRPNDVDYRRAEAMRASAVAVDPMHSWSSEAAWRRASGAVAEALRGAREEDERPAEMLDTVASRWGELPPDRRDFPEKHPAKALRDDIPDRYRLLCAGGSPPDRGQGRTVQYRPYAETDEERDAVRSAEAWRAVHEVAHPVVDEVAP